MKKMIVMVLGLAILSTAIFGQTIKTNVDENLQIKPKAKYDIKKDEYQFMAGFIIGPAIISNENTAKGLSTTYYRNIYDRFFVGASLNVYYANDYNKYNNTSNSYTTVRNNTDIKMLMLETKMRMNTAKRTHRFAGYVGLSAGYMINNSSYYSGSFIKNLDANIPDALYSSQYYSNKNSMVVKTSIQFKFNVSKNTGLLFENSLSVYNNQYSETNTLNYDQIGLSPFLTFKAGYFF